MAKHTLHVEITGDASDLVRQLEKATEAARGLCRATREAHRRVQVRPRGAGGNLSVDLVIDGWAGNVPLPGNASGVTRTDYFRIDGIEYGVRVRPGAAVIRDVDIEFRGDLKGLGES